MTNRSLSSVISPLQHRVIVSIVLIVTGVSIVRLSFNLGYNRGTFEHSDMVHRTCCVGLLESNLIPIAIALCIALFGFWIKGKIGLLLSVLAFLSVLTVYVLWYLTTLSVLRSAELSDFFMMPNQSQHLVPLVYATWWDVVVLGVVIALSLWMLRTWLKIHFEKGSQSENHEG